MRGGFIHNDVLIAELKSDFLTHGIRVGLEVAVPVGGAIGFIDLFVRLPDRRLAIEAELSAKRIAGDLGKATAARADELWIVVPTSAVAKSVRRKLSRLGAGYSPLLVFILTLGEARQRIKNCFPFNSVANA